MEEELSLVNLPLVQLAYESQVNHTFFDSALDFHCIHLRVIHTMVQDAEGCTWWRPNGPVWVFDLNSSLCFNAIGLAAEVPVSSSFSLARQIKHT